MSRVTWEIISRAFSLSSVGTTYHSRTRKSSLHFAHAFQGRSSCAAADQYVSRTLFPVNGEGSVGRPYPECVHQAYEPTTRPSGQSQRADASGSVPGTT
jgi:hypothetical protein